MPFQPNDYRHVSYLWEDAQAARLDPVERLVYRSNLLGTDQRITNTGGGNTSSKLMMFDPLTGESVEVLWVKGSGGDLRTADRSLFASLYMDKLRALRHLYEAAPKKGVKTPLEDQLVGMYPHTVYNLNPRASSIDTPLHAFIPFKHVDHTHPNAVIALAAARDQERLTRDIFGGEVEWVAWQRPGFDLGMVLAAKCAANPNLKGIILGQHGLINWANDEKECYELSLTLIEKAARHLEANDKRSLTFGGQKYAAIDGIQRNRTLISVLPNLRGMMSEERRFIATVQSDEATLQFVNSNDAARLAELGTSCPDHFLRTKIKPLYVDWNPGTDSPASLLAKLRELLPRYRDDYAAYYQACKHDDSPALRDPNPTVILIPGLGMITFGKNKSESRTTAEFYKCAIEVMRGAESVSQYVALPRQEAFDIEYWLLEEAKLRRMPAEKELERSVVVVVGAGSGIGRTAAERVAQEGAHTVCADLNDTAAEDTAALLTKRYGLGIGVAGTGISACGPAIALGVNMTDRDSVREMFEQVILAYGGIDHVIVTAGVFFAPDRNGNIPDEKWAQTFAVNVTGAYLVADEARPIWQAQQLRGSMVITTSVNAVVPKKVSLAYDTSKAAADHLIRELAIELAPLVRVNGLAPATVVEGSSMFPRDRVMSSLAKYNIAFEEDEDTETLLSKLSNFYAGRTLTKLPITPADQAEIAYLLISSKFSRTTGQIINVDGGLYEGFLR